MAPRKESSNDFESRYFDTLQGRLDRSDQNDERWRDDVKGILEKMLERTTRNEGDIEDLKREVFRKVVPWYSDSKLVYIALACLLVFLLILAAFLGVKVPSLPL